VVDRFNQLARDNGTSDTTADCANDVAGRDEYVRGESDVPIGEFACYVDLSIATMIWREDGSSILARVTQLDGRDRLSELFRWWRAFPELP